MTNVDFYKKMVELKNVIKEDINHSISYLSSLLKNTNSRVDDTQNATCDLSMEIDNRINDIENALCELSLLE